jgi:hypothetical protein
MTVFGWLEMGISGVAVSDYLVFSFFFFFCPALCLFKKVGGLTRCRLDNERLVPCRRVYAANGNTGASDRSYVFCRGCRL